MRLPRPLRMLKDAGVQFIADDAMSLAAALAFYAALSFAPLLILLLWFTTLPGAAAREELIAQIGDLMGEPAAETAETVIATAQEDPQMGTIAGIIGLMTLFVAATGAFAQLQFSLNRIWGVRARPGQGLWNWIRKRLLSLGMVFTIGFLLIVALVAGAVLTAVVQTLRGTVPGIGAMLPAVDFIFSMLIFTIFFAAMFKVLPDVVIAWRDVLVGAAITAGLFAVGKVGIGTYLGTSSIASAYGAAGSLIAFLLWVYYSALILFFGAELTQVRARYGGRQIAPDRHAVRLDRTRWGDSSTESPA